MAITIKRKWLRVVGGVKVERLTTAPNGKTIARSGQPVPLDQQPNGVLHTTEGHFGPSLDVFTSTGTPTWMVGYETLKVVGGKLTNLPATPATRIRVAQFMPIGEMCLTLKNAAGGVETNREALVQIELVGTSVQGAKGFGPWLPHGPVLAVLADLFRQIERSCGIPLVRAGDGTRSVARWRDKAGWFGHGEAPENDHTDPRGITWASILEQSGGLTMEKYNVAGLGQRPGLIAAVLAAVLRSEGIGAMSIHNRANVRLAAAAAAAADFRQGPRLVAVGAAAAATVKKAGHKLGGEGKSDLLGAVGEGSTASERLTSTIAEAEALLVKICAAEEKDAEQAKARFKTALVALDGALAGKV